MTDEDQKKCYGALEADVLKSVEGSLLVSTFRDKAPAKHLYGMVMMSMLSDAQELVERGMKEEARQMINRAKLVLTTKIMGI